MAKPFVVMMIMLATIANQVSADPDMLQDICVAELTSTWKVNGFPCKPTFAASDFFSVRLATPGLTNNLMGSNVTAANVNQIPGLNTLGVSMALRPLGTEPSPHPPTHHRNRFRPIWKTTWGS